MVGVSKLKHYGCFTPYNLIPNSPDNDDEVSLFQEALLHSWSMEIGKVQKTANNIFMYRRLPRMIGFFIFLIRSSKKILRPIGFFLNVAHEMERKLIQGYNSYQTASSSLAQRDARYSGMSGEKIAFSIFSQLVKMEVIFSNT